MYCNIFTLPVVTPRYTLIDAHTSDSDALIRDFSDYLISQYYNSYTNNWSDVYVS